MTTTRMARETRKREAELIALRACLIVKAIRATLHRGRERGRPALRAVWKWWEFFTLPHA